MTQIRGLTTGIGSLPHKNIDAALDLIFQYTPDIPFWPQLPNRDKRERMIAQYSEGLPFLRINRDGLSFDSSMQEQELTQFYEHIIADDKDYFKISPQFAAGFWEFLSRLEKVNLRQIEFIKGQVTGPFTFCASINDNEGKAILHKPVLMQAFREGLIMKALWQINLLRKFSKPIIMFLDEPYLACLGSGFTPINRKDVVWGLEEFAKRIKSADTLIGVHCCGNTDWSIFTEVANIDIISFDAFNFLDRVLLYTKELHGFLQRDGMLAWGIVPTEAFSPEISVAPLIQKLKDAFKLLAKKGLDEDLLKRRLILTPSCGLGILDLNKAEPIFKCLAELSSTLQSE